MGAFPAYTLNSEALKQLCDSMRTISIRVDSMGPPEPASLGIQQMWRCSNPQGQLFVLWATELNDKNLLGHPRGTVYLEIWPPEKGALKAKRKHVSAAFGEVEQLLMKVGAVKWTREDAKRAQEVRDRKKLCSKG